MTCIVGAVENGRVIMGGDSMASDAFAKEVRIDPKVFTRGPFVIGFTDSFRMGQVLRFNLSVPTHPKTIDDYEYMVTRFVESVRECLKTAGVAKSKNDVEEGGNFLVGYRGQLYCIDTDYQVGIVNTPYKAIGSGEEFAMGAMYAQSPKVKMRTRIRVALQAASKFSLQVGPPFTFVVSQE